MMDNAPQRDHHSPLQEEPRDPPQPNLANAVRVAENLLQAIKDCQRPQPPTSQPGKKRWSVGMVSAWRAHNPVSLLHSSCECDDLWSLRKDLNHAETGCGSANHPPSPPPHTCTTTRNTHTTHTHNPQHTHTTHTYTHTCTLTLITQSQRASSRSNSHKPSSSHK